MYLRLVLLLTFRTLTRVLPALHADAEAVRRVVRSNHVDGPHHQILVHVEVMVVLLGAIRRTGYGAPSPTPCVMCHLVARTATAPSTQISEYLFR
jgi:hypothetical protein